MLDITNKSNTLRVAVAQAIVKVSRPETIEAIKNKSVPKGDVFEMAKTAGLFAVKKTPEVVPDCHPLPIENVLVSYDIQDLEIRIKIQVKTIYRTGVEVEAMYGASVIALTMYDMLKPIDKGIEIHSIKLVSKKGGKSDFKERFQRNLKAGVVICSDSISGGKKEDKAGKEIIKKLEECHVEIQDYLIIRDETEEIKTHVEKLCKEKVDLIILTGGTGLSPRDVTPEAVLPILDREIPGIAEAARNYGQDRTPYSMLSRSVAGVKGETLIMALPGSTKGAAESMDALFPSVLHVFGILKGLRHN